MADTQPEHPEPVPEPSKTRPDSSSELTEDWSGRPRVAGGEPTVVSLSSSDDVRVSTAGVIPRFGDYELIDEVGRGGMGVVYRARQKRLDRIVALKMIRDGRLASAVERERFQAEARASARLRHPHIVPIFEAGEVDGQPYFVMEFLSGGSLADRLRDGPQPPKDAARILIPIALAVDYLHEQGIIHRDLKSTNVLLDGSGTPFVTDFGLIKLLEGDSGLTATGAVMGTPSAMSPEQAAGRLERIGPRSDVYSLGVILYELLCGVPPFRGETPMQTLVEVLEREPEPPSRRRPDVPAPLESICLKALAKEPSERYATARELAHDLQRFLDDEPVRAQSAGLLTRLGRWARAEPALASRAASVLFVNVAAETVLRLFGTIDARLPDGGWMLHGRVMTISFAWVTVLFGLQVLIRRGWRPEAVRMAWCLLDVLIYYALMRVLMDTEVLNLTAASLILVASALWQRVALVWVTACALAVSQASLLLEIHFRGFEFRDAFDVVISIGFLFAIAWIQAHLVRKLRVLSRYYEERAGG